MSWQDSTLASQFWLPAVHGGVTAPPYALLWTGAGGSPVITSRPGNPYSDAWSYSVNGPREVQANERFSVVRPVRPVPIRYHDSAEPNEGDVWGPMGASFELYPGLPGFTCCGVSSAPNGTAWFIADAFGVAIWGVVIGASGANVLVHPCRSILGDEEYEQITLTVQTPVANAAVGEPNVRAGAVIPFRMETAGTFVALGGYLDDPIGTIKIWPLDDEIPAGWTEAYHGLMLAGGAIDADTGKTHNHENGVETCIQYTDVAVIAADADESHLPPYRVVRWIVRTS